MQIDSDFRLASGEEVSQRSREVRQLENNYDVAVVV